jgi:hypothetical protein
MSQLTGQRKISRPTDRAPLPFSRRFLAWGSGEIFLVAAVVFALSVIASPALLRSQAMHGDMGVETPANPLGLSMQRSGSGTSWQPDATQMHAWRSVLSGWEVMLHGVAFVQYDDQGSQRGARQFGSVNWGMIAASHPLTGGVFNIRVMASAEPFTVGSQGYPLLLQSGETYRGAPLHDRQHPHDLLMEIAAMYDHAINDDVAVSIYAAPVGEPAIGPVAFPHRASAASDPLAPLGHHWQDATHISFGVITGGIYTRSIKLEGSVFNGREPDEIRTNLDYAGRSLDSYAGRLTVNPDAHLSLSGSYAYIRSPEQLEPQQSVHRIVAAAIYNRGLGESGDWASTFVYGANKAVGSARSNSWLAETNAQLDNRNTIFGRAELVEKSAGDLVVFTGQLESGLPSSPDYRLAELTLGYVREVTGGRGGMIGIGAAVTLNIVPRSLQSVYGSTTPPGGVLFLRFRPGLMNMSMQQGSAPMNMMKSKSESAR